MNENTSIQHIPFTVDAGLINRLGYELVGRAETAVSELIKNAYDADANLVTVQFVDSDTEGGTLIIEDDGMGMDFNQLVNGFMRIATADKVNNAVSLKYKRKRAGQKGIGRFATQRLGEKLTIITNTEQDVTALKLIVEWNAYKAGIALNMIVNPVEVIDKTKPFGTTLIIEKLREGWSKAAIERVFRYVTELLQPDYLSKDTKKLNLSRLGANVFQVVFEKITNGNTEPIANLDKIYLDKAIAVIEGFIDEQGDGFWGVKSERFKLDDYREPIFYGKEKKFQIVKNIHFKAYYFVYNFAKVEDYYLNFSKQELTRVKDFADNAGGIYLYRNGFRVLPYGEQGNDWLSIEKKGNSRGGFYAPFSNNNFFGFVQLIEKQESIFEETASREGLIETAAFKELTYFVLEALYAATNRVHAVRHKEQEEAKKLQKGEEKNEKIVYEKIKDIKIKVSNLVTLIPKTAENKEVNDLAQSIEDDFNATSTLIEKELTARIDENNMLRILAGLGLVIGEFTHEVGQFTPSISGIMHQLKQLMQGKAEILLKELGETFKRFFAYTTYFDQAIKRNINRMLEPIDLRIIVNDFIQSVEKDCLKSNITITSEFYGYELYTIPMHPSEWLSILFNFYTNAKKAIRRKGDVGKIKVVIERIEGKKNWLALEFMDNGDGIPPKNKDRIFDAFFSTSTPNGFDTPGDPALLGSGLGLKIVKDMVENYKGRISVIGADTGYNTCFRIEIAEATKKQKEDYGKD